MIGQICGASLRWTADGDCPNTIRDVPSLVLPQRHVKVHHLIPFGIVDSGEINM
jgi:hypothetical protein